MLLGIVSDTHGHQQFTQQAIRVLEPFDLAAVIHCGDIGSTDIPSLFAQWPTHFVFGNVDHDQPALRLAINQANLKCHERFGELEFADKKIAFLHSDDASKFTEVTRSNDWDLVCYGHTHIAKTHYVGKTMVLNPGAVFRANPRSVAIVSLPECEATIIPLQ